MGKARRILVCILIIGLDVAAGFLGRVAEQEQNKERHLRVWVFECREPSQEAFKLGVGAATLLGIAHVLANLFGGCTNCFCSQDKAFIYRLLTIACLVFTWILLAVGLSMLVIGARANHKSRATCGLTHRHLLSNGGIICFVHGILSVAYYVSATANDGAGS